MFEALLLSALVKDKPLYLKQNWLNLIIIALGLPLIWGEPAIGGILRILRLLILMSLLFHVGESLRKMFSRFAIGPTLLGCAIIILMAGVMVPPSIRALKRPVMASGGHGSPSQL